ncbi:DUF3857 domain-containing protein [Flavobacterium stagni]|uniref:DUF3857 domain-containing protein n=1 Tax=Flavobacterium stagni TaxID=2506421 RepID=A0A4V1N2K6_9FLAO|nr:DUF3857 domain-containing protein [Flavobacterium stagni]RXR22217.1 DUF3857 domain-containing protein [Flavobacterium stagni]
MYKPFLLMLFVAVQTLYAQNNTYSTLAISDNLKETANSVVREQEILVEIVSQKSYIIKKREVLTVLNVKGLNNLDANEHYSSSEKINAISAVVYNALGKELKKIKTSDFKDQSVADGYSILTDDRVLYLDYTPTEYPFTIVFESEVKSNNTAFLPVWSPINDFYESVQKSKITYLYPTDLQLNFKEFNFEGLTLQKNLTPGKLELQIENLNAIKPEDYTPSKSKILPMVRFALDKFNLVGVYGDAKTWKDHGIWVYNTLLKETDELPEETVAKMKDLVKGAKTDLEKAQRIYQYVQNKTRYVSIQLGVGGWKPMLAKDVDKLGYGDCKALTNYTRSLLNAVGVESFYTVIFAGREKADISEDFVAMQGNHVILALPNDKKYTFLECTSQDNPFGFQSDFTDDRLALVVKPQGGELIRTNNYNEKLSSQLISGAVKLNEDGTMSADFIRKSTGTQYSAKNHIQQQSKQEIVEDYKEEFSWLTNLSVEKYKHNDDKEKVEFTEELFFTATDYIRNNGGYLTFLVNPLNQLTSIPQRYRNRKFPLEISRGFYDEENYTIELPQGLKCEAIPEPVKVEDKFGTYTLTIKEISSNKLNVSRSLLVKKGTFDKSEYENFRKFREQIARYDGTKLLLIKA